MNNIFDIRDFGAVADGVTINTEAIQRAIDAAAENGGQVLIPGGRFVSGSLTLRSNIDFHLAPGAVLIASLDRCHIKEFGELRCSDELSSWTGGCFLFAKDESDIVISGTGTIYGQGEKVFIDDDGDGGYGECPYDVAEFRPRTSFFENIDNLIIRDITIRNAARWTLHMAGCNYVTVDGIRMFNIMRGANNDGVDLDSCKNVTVSNCIIETGDDAIVIKTTAPITALYGACENVAVNNCILASRDSAVKIGTETHGDIRNVVIGNCIVRDCSRGVGIWVRDGGTVEDIYVHHIRGAVRKYAGAIRPKGKPSSWWGNGDPVFIDATYRNEAKKFPGIIRNITLDHISLMAESSALIIGEPECPVENVCISDMDITLCHQGTQPCGTFDEQPSPRGVYEHSIPVIYCRYARIINMTARVRYIEPYNVKDNPFTETEHCEYVNIDIKEF